MAQSSLDKQIAIYEKVINGTKTTAEIKAEVKQAKDTANAVDANNNKQPTTEETLTEIKGHISARVDEISQPARYFKPVFLLQQMTPCIHARVHMKRSDGSPLVYDLFDQYTNPDTNTSKPIHNYIKSFEWDMLHKEDPAMLEVVDVDAYFLEELVMRMTAFSRDPTSNSLWDGLVYVEMEFGWYVPPTVAAQYSATNVQFTKTVMGILQKPDIKFDSNGIVRCTFHIRIDSALYPPLMWNRPYNDLGTNPAHDIILFEFINDITNIYTTDFSIKAMVKRKLSDIAIQYIKHMIVYLQSNYFDGAGEATDIIELIRVIVRMFDKNISAAVMSALNDFGAPQVVNVSNDIKSIANKNWLNTLGLTPSQMLANLQNQETLSVVMNPFDLNWPNMPIGQLTAQSPATSIWCNHMQNIRNVAMKAFTDSVNNDGDVNNVESIPEVIIVNFMEKVTPILLNAKIHPLLMEQYILGRFCQTPDSVIERYNENKPLGERGIDVLYVPIVSNSSIEPKWYWDSLQGKTNVDQKLTFDEKAKWCTKKVKDYTLDISVGWIDYINNIIQNQICNFKFADEESKNTIVSQTKDDPSNTSKKTKDDPLVQEVDVICNAFVCMPRGSKANIDLIKLIIKAKGGNNSTGEDLIEKARLNKQNFGNNYDVYHDDCVQLWLMKDIHPGTSLFNADAGLGNILQAFSYRPNMEDSTWNPGIPDVKGINYPDILSFDPTFDYVTAAASVLQNQRQAEVVNGENESSSAILQLLQTANRLASQITNEQKNKNAKAQTNNDVKQLKDVISQLKTQSNDLNNPIFQEANYFNFDIDPSKSRTEQMYMKDAIEGKRKVQDFRRRMLFSSVNMEASLRVVGDASYDINDLGKYIYLKVSQPDGGVSFFTGLWTVLNIKQAISAGKFETTFSLRLETTSDPDVKEAIKTAIYQQDNMSVKYR